MGNIRIKIWSNFEIQLKSAGLLCKTQCLFPPTIPTQQQRPIPPPSPPRSLPQQPTLNDLFDEEGDFFGTEQLDDVRSNFWNNNDTKF